MRSRYKKILHDYPKILPYPTCYATGVTAASKEKVYPLALQCMRQGKGGAVIHSGIQGSNRKYFVGNNWAYNINSSEGAHDETHRFSELCIQGIWHLIIKPIRGKTVAPEQEVKVWYPWADFTITTYLSTKKHKEYKAQDTRIKSMYPRRQKSPRR
jgi:hypothetical protein